MNKRKIIIIIVSIIILTGIISITWLYYNEKQEKNVIDNLKQELGITGVNEVYTIEEEYDGRKVLAIKPSVQYNVIMAGMLKGEKPENEELAQWKEKIPINTGIWINKPVREKFLKMINLIAKDNYTISETGFLKQEETTKGNEYDNILNKMIKSKTLYIIDISSKCYLLDEVTGEIVEYPFEKMDPYTPFEYFEFDNKCIFIINSNEKGKLEDTDSIKEILDNVHIR